MLIGAHVRTAGSLLGALARGRAVGADVVQIFTQSPRMWRSTRHDPEQLARYRDAQAEDPCIVATYCHASYLINLASSDPVLLERSRKTLASNLAAARALGAAGLVVHVGSHLGRGFDAVADQVVEGLLWGLGATPTRGVGGACPILVENTAGAGGSIGASLEELGVLLERAGAGDALGICLDTQHLWASGVSFGSPAEADEVVAALDATVGLRALRCLHLNDSKTALGSRADRHANLGVGTIGEKGLGCLLAHRALEGLPAILEVAGAGDGPRAEDVASAREILSAGRRLWEETGRPAAEWERRPSRTAKEER